MPRSLLIALVVILLAAAGFIATPPALISDAAVQALPDDNEGQERYWSTSYPSAIIVEVMRLVDLANASLPLQVDQSILTLLSPNDQVVSHQATIEALRQIDALRKRLIEFDDVGDPSKHVLAGNILSPDNTDEVLERTLDFVRGLSIAE